MVELSTAMAGQALDTVRRQLLAEPHSQQAVVPLELKPQPQRQRQCSLAYRRHEPGPGGFREGTADKVIQPSLTPTLQRPRVDLQY